MLLSTWHPISVSWMNDMITCGIISPISSSPALLPARTKLTASSTLLPLPSTVGITGRYHYAWLVSDSSPSMQQVTVQSTAHPCWSLLFAVVRWQNHLGEHYRLNEKKKTEWIKENQWAMHTIQLTQQQGSEMLSLEGKWAEPCSVREAGVTQTTVRIVSLTHEIWGGWKIQE